MPIKVKGEDGNEFEVPTQEEHAAVIKKAEDAEKALKDRDLKIKELEEEVNPNFREIRKALKEKDEKIKALEAKGKTINEEGEVVDIKREVNADDLIKRAEQAGEKASLRVLLERKKSEFLSKFDDKERELAKSKLEKLTSGEDVNLDNIDSFFDDTIKLVRPSLSVRDRVFGGRGLPPVMPKQSTEEKQRVDDVSKSFGLHAHEVK